MRTRSVGLMKRELPKRQALRGFMGEVLGHRGSEGRRDRCGYAQFGDRALIYKLRGPDSAGSLGRRDRFFKK
jgi:hypothetical protein